MTTADTVYIINVPVFTSVEEIDKFLVVLRTEYPQDNESVQETIEMVELQREAMNQPEDKRKEWILKNFFGVPDGQLKEYGGEGSGHWGHEGRPGEVGGSLPEGEGGGKGTELDLSPGSLDRWDATKALNDYQNLSHSSINDYLRGGKHFTGVARQDAKHDAEILIKAFNTKGFYKVTKEEQLIYRGISDDKMYAYFSKRGVEMVGKIITDKAFLSTTRDPEIAYLAASQWTDKKVILSIYVPKGARYISGRREEKEMIFNRNSRLKVVRVDRSEDEISITARMLL